MSKTTKWIIGIVIIVVLALLWWNMNGSGSTSQSAATVNSTSTSLDQVHRDVANIDVQMAASAKEVAGLGQAPTQVAVVTSANHLKTIALLIGQLRIKLETGMVNSKSTSLLSTLNDMGTQISNASSQAGVVVLNAGSITGTATVSNNKTLAQSIIQLKTALTYLQVARVDVGTIVATLR